ncbi:MAG: hypothetical protein ABI720_08660 [Actinomycetes bacterium]
MHLGLLEQWAVGSIAAHVEALGWGAQPLDVGLARADLASFVVPMRS